MRVTARQIFDRLIDRQRFDRAVAPVDARRCSSEGSVDVAERTLIETIPSSDASKSSLLNSAEFDRRAVVSPTIVLRRNRGGRAVNETTVKGVCDGLADCQIRRSAVRAYDQLPAALT